MCATCSVGTPVCAAGGCGAAAIVPFVYSLKKSSMSFAAFLGAFLVAVQPRLKKHDKNKEFTHKNQTREKH